MRDYRACGSWVNRKGMPRILTFSEGCRDKCRPHILWKETLARVFAEFGDYYVRMQIIGTLGICLSGNGGY